MYNITVLSKLTKTDLTVVLLLFSIIVYRGDSFDVRESGFISLSDFSCKDQRSR